MAKISGKNLYVEFGGTDISGNQRSFSITESQEQADATAGADAYRNYVNTMKTIEASVEILVEDFASTGGSALLAALDVGTQGTLIWGPEGTATGKPKKGFYATITQFDQALPFDDVYSINVTFTMAGTALAFDGVTDTY